MAPPAMYSTSNCLHMSSYMGACFSSARMASLSLTPYLSRNSWGTTAEMSTMGLPIPRSTPARPPAWKLVAYEERGERRGRNRVRRAEIGEASRDVEKARLGRDRTFPCRRRGDRGNRRARGGTKQTGTHHRECWWVVGEGVSVRKSDETRRRAPRNRHARRFRARRRRSDVSLRIFGNAVRLWDRRRGSSARLPPSFQ